MKYLLYTLPLALCLSVFGQEDPNHELRKQKMEQKAQDLRKKNHEELLKKYDINKDGKLDKEERSKITPEDRKKMGPPRKKQPRTGGPDPIPEHLKKN
jgi:hypothetical protein